MLYAELYPGDEFKNKVITMRSEMVTTIKRKTDIGESGDISIVVYEEKTDYLE